jgi:hypothetical protein
MGLPNEERINLDTILKHINPSSPSACGNINAFIFKVNNDRSHAILTLLQANMLSSQAKTIGTAIDCPYLYSNKILI